MSFDLLRKILLTHDGQGKAVKTKALEDIINLVKLEAIHEMMHQEPDRSEFDSMGQ